MSLETVLALLTYYMSERKCEVGLSPRIKCVLNWQPFLFFLSSVPNRQIYKSQITVPKLNVQTAPGTSLHVVSFHSCGVSCKTVLMAPYIG